MKYFLVAIILFVGGCDQWSDYINNKYGDPTFRDKFAAIERINQYPVTPAYVNPRLEFIVGQWQKVFDITGISCDTTDAIHSSGLSISWQSHPFLTTELPNEPLVGLTNFEGYGIYIRVGYLPEVSDTALGWEMAHVILYECGLDYSDEEVGKWLNKYDLPD